MHKKHPVKGDTHNNGSQYEGEYHLIGAESFHGT
jgi:hypothetical protein